MSKHDFQMPAEAIIYQEIGRRIREERQALGFNQHDLAQEVGCLRTSIANIEVGRQRLPIYLLYRIATALGTSVNDLMPKREEISA